MREKNESTNSLNEKTFQNEADVPLSKLAYGIIHTDQSPNEHIPIISPTNDDEIPPPTLAGNIIRQYSAPEANKQETITLFPRCPPPLSRSQSTPIFPMDTQIVLQMKELYEEKYTKTNYIRLISDATLLSLSMNELSVALSYLSIKDLLNILKTCKHTRVVASTNQLWMPLVKKKNF